eukprot:scaffold2910_cov390-Prasinococcus_capsulatus_cf.AAC.50
MLWPLSSQLEAVDSSCEHPARRTSSRRAAGSRKIIALNTGMPKIASFKPSETSDWAVLSYDDLKPRAIAPLNRGDGC